ncbi:two-component system response regulator [Erysipelothrix larvae]|uniref:Two-component system response regulator n=1 Tax=Erysipelothrix larvae TaxID=1514105 RepID=A0A0X8GZ11_9FIRM|nr:response regulator transcription factor [Erysipelothrix larvae]AMC93026.1 two-component system response regulator [Erysipelothrix larvae]
MRLLLAEDEQDLREAMVEILKQHHFSVDAVENGEEALEYIEFGDNYDCLILDIMMPVMDGISVIKALREQKRMIPILVLSAKSEIDDRVLGLDTGADDYLVKPFDVQELLARIRVLTRRPINEQTSTLTIGNVTLDRANYSIQTEKGQLVLPNKEFQILELLMVNPQNVISSDAIFSRVWGLDSDADQNTVWVTLSNLRRKLNVVDATLSIKSVRNVGYTLEVTQ